MADPNVVAWYHDKTSFLLDKYGPGPRVHYHTGLVAPSVTPATDFEGLRKQIWDSQEAMNERAAREWDAAANLRGELIDVGCGLGGGPLWWAERYGARVVGLTPIPAHVPVIEAFAARAGVTDRVHAELGDAHTVPGEGRFDAAVTMGATNYLDRRRWFARLATLLRPGGQVFIEDTFLGREDMQAPFNAYWVSNIGWFVDYEDAAREHGFELVRRVDVTAEAAGFWRLSVAWSRLMLASEGLSGAARDERLRSIAWQTAVYEAYLDGGFENLLLHFAKAR